MPTELTPERLHDLELKARSAHAAGLPALRYSLQHVDEHMHYGDGLRLLTKLNQKNGFDCPGCAWPDPDDSRTPVAEYCENGVKAIAEEATRRRADPAFFARHSIEQLGEMTDFELGKSGRITHPMYLAPGASHYTPVPWEEAYRIIATELNALDSPDEAIFYTSGRASNEAAFLYQLFVRQYGTNNLPDCSNMCHESTGTALGEVLGLGKGSVTLEDIHQADLIICVGQNPGTNHPRMLSALEKCKENGGRMISINPLPETGLLNFINPQRPLKILTGGTALTDLFLQVRINEDLALVRAICKLLLAAEAKAPGRVFDQDFIAQHTSGYAAWVRMLEETDLEACLAGCGVTRAEAEEAAEMIIASERIVLCYAMGLTQHENSVDVIKEMVNLLLCKGSIGKPGAGICPVRGHSNVQGDRTVGIWEKLKPEFRERLRSHFNFEPPARDGFDVVNSCKAMTEGRAKVFFALGGNFLSATPDTLYTARGLRQCALTVHVSTKPNRSHVVHGTKALILPCLGRTEIDLRASGEQFVSCENSMGVVQMSKGVLAPASDQLRSECAIIAELAQATLDSKSTVDWLEMANDYDQIRNAIAACVPGFERYNERVREPSGFYLPNGPRNRRFDTPDGKAHFSTSPVSHHTLEPGEYLMMTVRSHDQYNTTIYGMHDRYRGIHNERRVVMMNEDDLAAANLTAGDCVDLSSSYDGETRHARLFRVVAYPIPRGNVATYFPEANVLVPISRTARGSNTPISKSVRVKIYLHQK
ncbi:FdhF/YdeP family oxidoreductase [Neolewinella lacunae]|uniref:FdhF/YdeP family oxidoreductase n=1 Tax=Neolewinella lacunae TaxID=1517758 RepID=A0A923PQM7_9BACT|nr:FdhF/YdeP family oxidoreductase [Neolewinella lacunae]MBC6995673.1 FdhF/YdeP family oxidoreductase [Neolewinella lacunae]MDN3634259.1 FdhF/YdeP family oxidoreductase [Neolewinella lacunae]